MDSEDKAKCVAVVVVALVFMHVVQRIYDYNIARLNNPAAEVQQPLEKK